MYLIVLVGILMIYSNPLSVGAVSPWYSGDPEVISSGSSTSSDEHIEFLENKTGYTAGLTCIEKRIATRAFGSLSVQYKDGCWYDTEIGLLEQGGYYLLQPGEEVAGYIFVHSHPGSQSQLLPTPNRDVFIELLPASATGSGNYIQFRTLNELGMTRERHATGTVTLRYIEEPIFKLKNSFGGLTHTRHRDVWWSNDGAYMLIRTKYGQIHRINMETFKVLSLYEDTLRFSGSVAISPSGRYISATVEHASFADLKLFDTEACDETELDHTTNGTSCDKRTFKHVIQNNISSFYVPIMPRFYGEHTLGFYHKATGATTYNQYYLQANGTEFKSSDYVALGDSFSSGEGAGDYLPGTDELDVNMCHTSTRSYPYLINEQLDLTDFLSVACSGARMEHFWWSGQYKDSLKTYGDDHPGAVPQRNHIELADVITLTMSGNDIGFKEKLEYCLIWSSDCYSSYERRSQIANEIRGMHGDLVELYGYILDKGSKLYVVGYPQIISNDEGVACGVNTPMNTYQRNMANDLITYFNAVIRSAAAHAGAYYVGTESALNGHRLCDDVSATMAVNGITLGNDIGVWKLRGLSNGTFHPNQLGHQLLKNVVLSETSGLAESMPPPDTSVPIPDPEKHPFLDAPHAPELIRKLYYNPQAKPTLWKIGADAVIKITNPSIPVPPLTTFDVFLHSDTVELGQITSNYAGFFDTTLKIPNIVHPGMHELHIQGVDKDGNAIDIYQFVFVAADEDDFDGDGILNEDEPCGIIPTSGYDTDGDGIDDVCDSVITVSSGEEQVRVSSAVVTNNYRHTGETSLHAGGIQPRGSEPQPNDDSSTKVAAAQSEMASTLPGASNTVEERLSRSPAGPILIFIGMTTATLTLIYHLRYAKD